MFKRITSMLLIFMLLGLTGCQSASPAKTDDASPAADSSPTAAPASLPSSANAPNGRGNHLPSNNGYAVTDGEWIYYDESESYDLRRCAMDGSKDEVFWDYNPMSEHITLMDGRFYTQTSTVESFDMQGQKQLELAENAEYYAFWDGYIYCTRYRRGDTPLNGIYKVSPQSGESTLVLTPPDAENCKYLAFDQGWMYFKCDDGKLLRAKPDGSQCQQINDPKIIWMDEFIIQDGWVYNADGRKFHVDQPNDVINLRDPYTPVWERFNLMGDTLYFAIYHENDSEVEGLYTMKTDGTEKKQLAQGHFTSITLVGDRVMTYDMNNECHVWIHQDGTVEPVAKASAQ